MTPTKYNRIKKSETIKLLKSNKVQVITAGLILGTSLMLVQEAIDTRAKATGNNLSMLNIQETWNDDTGDYLYYGTYKGQPIPYRILDFESDSLLLDCDVGLYPLPYNIEETQANDWKDSHIYQQLNAEGFLGDEEILSITQVNAIKSSNQTSGTYKHNRRDGTPLTYLDTQGNAKVFALSGNQLHAYYPKEEDRIKASIDKPKESVYWWIASKGELDDQSYGIGIDGLGVESYMSEESSVVYVSPSFYLDTNQITYIWPASEKKSYFEPVKWGEKTNKWKATLIAGTGFQVKRSIGDYDWEQGGHKVTYTILDTGQSDDGISYNQVSAILYDDEMNMLAYGKVAHAHIKELSVTIPDQYQDKSLTLALFMEDTSGTSDYSSNVITTELGEQGILKELDKEPEEPTIQPENVPEVELESSVVVKPESEQVSKSEVEPQADSSPPKIVNLNYADSTGVGQDVVNVSGVIDSTTGLIVTANGMVTTHTIETIEYLSKTYTTYTEEEIYTEVVAEDNGIQEDEALKRSRYLFLILLNALTIQRIWWNIRVRGQVKRQQNGLIELSKYYKDENE